MNIAFYIQLQITFEEEKVQYIVVPWLSHNLPWDTIQYKGKVKS
jgi:hypothetical protein